MRCGRLDPIFLRVGDRALSHEAVEQVRDAADEAAVVPGAGNDLPALYAMSQTGELMYCYPVP